MSRFGKLTGLLVLAPLAGQLALVCCNKNDPHYQARNQEENQRERAALIANLRKAHEIIPLVLVRSIPTGRDVENGPFLINPLNILSSANDHLYVSDARTHSIIEIDDNGRIIGRIGEYGQGPGEFNQPSNIEEGSGNFLFVLDTGNQRVSIRERKEGWRSFRIFWPCSSMAADNHDNIYLGLLHHNFKSLLITALNKNGRQFAHFGNQLDANSPLFNDVDISVAREEIYVAWRTYPLVRRYTLTGKLIAEHQYDYGPAREFGEYNKIAVLKNGRIRFRSVINKIRAYPDAYYLLVTYPVLSIIKMDNGSGKVAGVYSVDTPVEYAASDFFVRTKEGKEYFYILEGIPEPIIRVYCLGREANGHEDPNEIH
jgi:hypothetical protein